MLTPSSVDQTPTTHPFGFSQDNRSLFVLYLKTIFLSIVTLGVYYFWGKVAITKYIYAHTFFGKRSFDYHATGKEMFLGFVKGIAILGGVGVLFGLLIHFLPVLRIPLMASLYIAFIFVLLPFVLVGKWRFMLSRSSYCNVRFRYLGQFSSFIKLWVPGALLTFVTFGLYSPVFMNKIQKFYTNQIRFGSLSFSYDGVNKEFFWIWFKGALLTIITLGIYNFWMVAQLSRYIFAHTQFNNRKFNSTLTGSALFSLTITNFLIIVFTLGLGFPIATNRMYNYFFSNVTLEMDPEEIVTLAGTMDVGASALASGLEDAVNVVDALSGIV